MRRAMELGGSCRGGERTQRGVTHASDVPGRSEKVLSPTSQDGGGFARLPRMRFLLVPPVAVLLAFGLLALRPSRMTPEDAAARAFAAQLRTGVAVHVLSDTDARTAWRDHFSQPMP